MTDAIEIHFLYPESVDLDAKLELFESLREAGAARDSRSEEEIRDLIKHRGFRLFNFLSGSVHPTLDTDPSIDGLPDMPQLTLHFEQKEFRERHHTEDEISEHVDDVVALVTELYELSVDAGHAPHYVIGGNPTDTEHLRTDHDRIRTTDAGIENHEVEELYWLQVWPPEMVSGIGDETIETAPADRIQTLEDGGVLLLAHKNPVFVGDNYLDLLEHLSLSR